VSEKDDFYYLKKLSSAHTFLYDVISQIADEKKGMKDVFENLDSYIQKACSRIVEEKPDMIIHKSTIQ
jgi:hypothetical protein